MRAGTAEKQQKQRDTAMTKLRSHPPTRLLVSSILAMFLGIPAFAHATDATAETLYQEGRRAAQQKDWDLACKKFKESLDREPAPGTLLNLGDCEERRGRLVAAEGHFISAARL